MGVPLLGTLGGRRERRIPGVTLRFGVHGSSSENKKIEAGAQGLFFRRLKCLETRVRCRFFIAVRLLEGPYRSDRTAIIVVGFLDGLAAGCDTIPHLSVACRNPPIRQVSLSGEG